MIRSTLIANYILLYEAVPGSHVVCKLCAYRSESIHDPQLPLKFVIHHQTDYIDKIQYLLQEIKCIYDESCVNYGFFKRH